MTSTMHYNNYIARIEYDESSNLFHGRVLGIKDVVEFYGKTPEELYAEFKVSMEEYHDMCAEDHVSPEKDFKGKFTLRTDAEHHRNYVLAATSQNISLNAWANQVLSEAAQHLRH